MYPAGRPAQPQHPARKEDVETPELFSRDKGRERELDSVERWRFGQFLNLGFPNDRAETMALLRQERGSGYVVDLNQVRKMRAGGCTADTCWHVVI